MLRGKPKPKPAELLKLEGDMEDAVRIFPFQQFDSITQVQLGHPISAEAVGDGLFVVPTIHEKINLYGIEEKADGDKTKVHCTLISDFAIVSVSRSVHFMHHTGWLLSLERHQTQKTIARIYLNWRTRGPALSCIPERDSIGEIIALSFIPTEEILPTQEEYMKHYQGVSYVDVPADRNIRRVSVCPTTNRVAFATKNHIRVWSYKESRIELLYTVKVDFDIKTIDLYGEYLAYASGSEVRIIRVCVQKRAGDFSGLLGVCALFEPYELVGLYQDIVIDETDPYRSSPAEPFTPIEDDHMVECKFNSVTGSSLDPKRVLIIPTAGVQRTRQNSLQKAPLSSGDATFEVLGPTENIHCITPNFLCRYSVVTCTVLVHRQFSSKAFLHTVHFLPEFHLIPENLGVDNNLSTEAKRERILRNIKRQTNLDEQEMFEDKTKTIDMINTSRSVRCMIGTSRKGYLYDVSDPRLLSEYSFTEHTISLQMTSSVMYTLTMNSLIMWSIRCCSSAGERFPSPCVLGMEPVQNPRHLSIVGDYLLVTPYIDFDESEQAPRSYNPTTILHTKSLLSLFNEIREFALLNEKTSYEAYFQLMLELHFLLEAKLQSLNQRLMHTNYYHGIFDEDQPNDVENEQELDQLQIESTLYHEKHKESSGALGDYQYRTELYSRAAVFYADSDRMASTIIEPMLVAATTDESKSSARRGILHYLDAVLFDSDKREVIDETTELADRILAIYHTFARSRMASVILESELRLFNQETALRLLEDPRTVRQGTKVEKKRYFHASAPSIKPPNTSSGLNFALGSQLPFQSGVSLKNVFVRGLLYLDLGHAEEAAADFLSLEPDVLVDFCSQNPEIFQCDLSSHRSLKESILPGIRTLHRSGSTATDTLGQLLYKNDPWTLLDILVRIVQHVPVSEALQLLHIQQIDDLSGDMLFLLENYLEWVLLSGHGTTEAFEKLSFIYARHLFSNYNEHPRLSSSMESSRKLTRQKWIKTHRDTFIHQREEWLHQIKPFDGVNMFASRSPFASEDEPLPELFYLQKLQGLLSVDHVAFTVCVDKLLEMINAKKEFTGKMSLELLCLPLAGRLMDAMEKIVKDCPHVTCLYAIKYCRTSQEWKEVIDYLSNSITSCQVYTDIISHLVKTQDPITFVSLLPENGNMNFFLPFIEQCFRCHYAAHLKQSIVDQAKRRVR